MKETSEEADIRRTMGREKIRQRRMNETPEEADTRRLKEKKRSRDRRAHQKNLSVDE